jgi:hypothetical protein
MLYLVIQPIKRTTMALKRTALLCMLIALFFAEINAQEIQKLENPFTSTYLKENLNAAQPRLGLNTQIERDFLKKIASDPVTKNMYLALKRDALQILDEPLLERKLEGRRLLHVSREMLYRMNCLAMLYRVEKDEAILDRIDKEILAVSAFSDWNPSHFLDVAEMALAVSIGLDWTAGDLPKSTIEIGENALIEKAIETSFEGNNGRRFFGTNNWNQVCNGGLIAAAITIAERNPELAAKTLSRSMEGIPIALEKYMPDGVYPEGATYWTYGTGFTVATIAMLESAFNNDFGISDLSAFIKSADYKVQMNTPTGMYYNFADCGTSRNTNGDVILAWFASHTGNSSYFEKERFLMPIDKMTKQSRLCGLGLVWLSQFAPKTATSLQQNWKGDGENPLVVFRDKNEFYFGGKGGRATTSHGNMDAGSFIFEYKGIRWVTDPGNQRYHDLEKEGFDLWNFKQDGERWTLLTKNNFGHSTLSVNNAFFDVNGDAKLLHFDSGDSPKAEFDLTPLYFGNIKHAKRTFLKDRANSILITDNITASEKSEFVTWQMLTETNVEITSSGAVLKSNGKHVTLSNLSHPDIPFKIVSLDPPPLKLDKRMEGLKRLELHIPVSELVNGETEIQVRITGE